MTIRLHPLPTAVLLATAMLFLGSGPIRSQPPKKADPTAVAIAQAWRYPGVSAVDTSLTPLKSEAFYIEKYAVEADFADVWNHFAAKSGADARYKDNMKWALMGKLNTPRPGDQAFAPGRRGDRAAGHFMVFGNNQEAHFGQNSENRTIHVEIRRSGEKKTAVCVVVGVR